MTNQEQQWYKDFCRDAKYMKDSPKMKYVIRYNGEFFCDEEPSKLFEKYKKARQDHEQARATDTKSTAHTGEKVGSR